jgi:hypothetical protein
MNLDTRNRRPSSRYLLGPGEDSRNCCTRIRAAASVISFAAQWRVTHPQGPSLD